MCLGSPSSKPQPNHPEAYRIHRHPVDGPGVHERRYSSVERHLNSAPPIRAEYKGKRYPHQYRNSESLFPSDQNYFEFPTSAYPYALQNSKGAVRGQPGIEGFTRTVTNQHRNIPGVMYHPLENRKIFVRAQEIYSSR